jgi:hypothetical protein
MERVVEKLRRLTDRLSARRGLSGRGDGTKLLEQA